MRKVMAKRTKNTKIWYEDLKIKYTVLSKVTVKQILIISYLNDNVKILIYLNQNINYIFIKGVNPLI